MIVGFVRFPIACAIEESCVLHDFPQQMMAVVCIRRCESHAEAQDGALVQYDYLSKSDRWIGRLILLQHQQACGLAIELNFFTAYLSICPVPVWLPFLRWFMTGDDNVS